MFELLLVISMQKSCHVDSKEMSTITNACRSSTHKERTLGLCGFLIIFSGKASIKIFHDSIDIRTQGTFLPRHEIG